MTQVTALAAVKTLSRVHVWSPNVDHAEALVRNLVKTGFSALTSPAPGEACGRSEVGSTITSSKTAFPGPGDVEFLQHLNVCGSNQPERAEVSPEVVAKFETVVVDSLEQAREESGDLIEAAKLGASSGVRQWS